MKINLNLTKNLKFIYNTHSLCANQIFKSNFYNNSRQFQFSIKHFSDSCGNNNSTSSNITNMLNKNLFKNNKDFASQFKDSQEFHYLYNTNLLNILYSMFIVKRSFDTIVFMGNNPELILQNLPKSKI
jgi:hypothetical protein